MASALASQSEVCSDKVCRVKMEFVKLIAHIQVGILKIVVIVISIS